METMSSVTRFVNTITTESPEKIQGYGHVSIENFPSIFSWSSREMTIYPVREWTDGDRKDVV
jgi:hypothetical protein